MRKNGLRTTKACRGKYLAFCEGDDYWHDANKMQKQMDYLESHPECAMVFGDCDVYNAGSAELKRSINYYKGFQSPENLTIKQILDYDRMLKWTCTVVARRNLIEQVIEGDPHLHKNEKFLMGDI